MGRLRWLLVFLAAASLVLAAAGPAHCGPKRGGALKIATTVGTPVCLGWPADVRKVLEITYGYPCVETLLRYDKNGKPSPHLATGWEIDKDGKSITFFLRKGVKFHDGTGFNAEAVKWSFELFRKASRAEFKMVTGIDVVDDYTLRLNLSYFNNTLLSNLCYFAGVVASPTAGEKMGRDAFCIAPVGTGPFKFKSMERDVSIKFERFDGYWQKDKPYLDALEWVLIKDPMTALAYFKSGEADVLWGVPLSDAAALKKTGQYDIRTIKYAVWGTAGDSANPDSPFANLKVRQAVSYAIDSQAIAESILHGLCPATNQGVHPNSWGYNPDTVGYPYDPAKAKKLLAEAGYANGFKCKLWGLNVSPYAEVQTAVQGYLAEVGVEVEFVPQDWGAWAEMLMKTGWKNGMHTVGMGQTHTDDTRNPEANLTSRVKYWDSMLKPQEADDKLLEALKTTDWDEKVRLTREYNKMIVDKYCLVNWIFVDNKVCALTKKVHDSGIFEVNFSQFTPENIWLDN